MAGSLTDLRFSSLAATRLGTSHLDGMGDDCLELALPGIAGEECREFAFKAGDGSRESSTFVSALTAPLFPTDNFAETGEENRVVFPEQSPWFLLNPTTTFSFEANTNLFSTWWG